MDYVNAVKVGLDLGDFTNHILNIGSCAVTAWNKKLENWRIK